MNDWEMVRIALSVNVGKGWLRGSLSNRAAIALTAMAADHQITSEIYTTADTKSAGPEEIANWETDEEIIVEVRHDATR
jgi:hypothetical protein